ncbi:MAG: thiamine phosphate synthase, partial [Pseudolabrys sp.]|nr:thiamine phosphate synthase [Pseudolabrys sp.]
PIVQDQGAALLLAGHAGLVARSGADGAHLSGMADFTTALELLKPERIAGAGSLASRHDAMVAAEAGADYLMFGDAGTTQREVVTIAEQIVWCSELFELPCAAFAANAEEIELFVKAGADFIALDYIWSDARGIAAAISDAGQRARLPETVT